MSFKNNILSGFASQIIRIVIGLATSIILTRGLGTEGKGHATYLLLVFGLFSSYGHFGITNAAVYFQKRTSYAEKEICCVNLTFLVIMTAIWSLVVYILKTADIAIGQYSILTLCIGVLFIISCMANESIKTFFIGRGAIITLNKFLALESLLELLLVLFLLTTNILTASIYLLIRSLVYLIVFLKLFYKLKIKYRPALNFKLLLSEFKYGVIVYFSAVFIFINYRADQFIIHKFLDVDKLGIYSIAVMIAELIFLIPISIQSTLESKFFNISDKSIERIDLLKMTVKFTFYICLFIAVICATCTPAIRIIYGNDFKEAEILTIILLAGTVFASIGKVSASYYFSIGKPSVHFKITLTCLIINVCLNLLLIPQYGLLGAASAAAASNMLYGVLYILQFVRKEEIKFSDFFKLKKSDIDIFVQPVIGKIMRVKNG